MSLINVEVVTEYEVDLDELIENHPDIWEQALDEEEFINELIENNWIQPYDLGESTHSIIKVF